MDDQNKLARFYGNILKKYIKYCRRRTRYGYDFEKVPKRECEFRDLKKNIEDILKIFIDKNINVYVMKSYEDRLKACTVLTKYCLKTLLDRLSPNTIILKLLNFKAFMVVSMDMRTVLPMARGRILKDFLKEDLRLIVKNLNASEKSAKLRNLQKDPARAIYAEDIDLVMKSSYYLNGWKALTDFENYYYNKNENNNNEVNCCSNLGEYSPSNLRDILIFQLLTATSSRSGVISNLTLNEYDEIEKLPRLVNGESVVADLYLLKCHAHKTSSKYNEANLFLTRTIKEGLDSYVKFIRPLLLSLSTSSNVGKTSTFLTVGNELGNIFITDKGKFFSPQSVYNSMRRLAERCGLKKRFTSSRNRKGTITETIENQPHLKKNVCAIMCHSERIAERCYKSFPDIGILKDAFCNTMKGKKILNFSETFLSNEK